MDIAIFHLTMKKYITFTSDTFSCLSYFHVWNPVGCCWYQPAGSPDRGRGCCLESSAPRWAGTPPWRTGTEPRSAPLRSATAAYFLTELREKKKKKRCEQAASAVSKHSDMFPNINQHFIRNIQQSSETRAFTLWLSVVRSDLQVYLTWFGAVFYFGVFWLVGRRQGPALPGVDAVSGFERQRPSFRAPAATHLMGGRGRDWIWALLHRQPLVPLKHKHTSHTSYTSVNLYGALLTSLPFRATNCP